MRKISTLAAVTVAAVITALHPAFAGLLGMPLCGAVGHAYRPATGGPAHQIRGADASADGVHHVLPALPGRMPRKALVSRRVRFV